MTAVIVHYLAGALELAAVMSEVIEGVLLSHWLQLKQRGTETSRLEEWEHWEAGHYRGRYCRVSSTFCGNILNVKHIFLWAPCNCATPVTLWYLYPVAPSYCVVAPTTLTCLYHAVWPPAPVFTMLCHSSMLISAWPLSLKWKQSTEKKSRSGFPSWGGKNNSIRDTEPTPPAMTWW